jgi:hypothetical protein
MELGIIEGSVPPLASTKARRIWVIELSRSFCSCAERFRLEHLQLVDQHLRLGELGRHRLAAGARQAAEEVEDVLRLHHHQLGEALREFLRGNLGFVGHGIPYSGLTVATTNSSRAK